MKYFLSGMKKSLLPVFIPYTQLPKGMKMIIAEENKREDNIISYKDP
jgi:hypothetical protein